MMKMIITLSLFIAFTFSQPPGVSDRDHENARMMKKWKLIEYLDLNEEQSEKFFVMVNAFQKEMKTIHKKKKKLREDIHEMLEEDKLNDIKRKIKEGDSKTDYDAKRRKQDDYLKWWLSGKKT